MRTGKFFAKARCYLYGVLCGVLNGLFGSGGGIMAVPCMEKSGLEPKRAHASSVAMIFALSLFTALLYLLHGELDAKLAVKYIPWGIIGAAVGAALLKKTPDSLLRRIFGAVIIISAVKMLFF